MKPAPVPVAFSVTRHDRRFRRALDAVGQRTNILFMGVKVNEPVDASQFVFDAPAGVDVIEDGE